MRRTWMSFILVLLTCMAQFTVVAVAQQQPSETTGEQVGATANTTPGAAGGTSGPALTGVRRPLYRLDETVESHLLNVKSMLKSRTLGEDVHLRPGDVLFVPQNLISKIRQFLPASSLSLYANPTGF